MKKQILLTIAVIAFLVMGGSVAELATQQKAHAQTPATNEQTTVKQSTGSQVTDGKEVAGKETSDSKGVKETENDGPGGHQDPTGTNVDHQFNGSE